MDQYDQFDRIPFLIPSLRLVPAGVLYQLVFCCNTETGTYCLACVQVTLMDEAEVLRHLSKGTDKYAYISSMAVQAGGRVGTVLGWDDGH
jgi:hypothetical protein